MTPRVLRCTQCVTVPAAIIALAWTSAAFAQSGMQEVSSEFWLGLFFTVMFGLVAAYSTAQAGFAKGMEERLDRRMSLIELEQRNRSTELSLFIQTLPDRFYTKAEAREIQNLRDQHTAEHRERMEAGLRDVKDCVSSMNGRLDNLAHTREPDSKP